MDFATTSMITQLTRPYSHEKRSIQEGRAAAPEAGVPVPLAGWNLSVVTSKTQTIRFCIATCEHLSTSKSLLLAWSVFHSLGIWIWPGSAMSRSYSPGVAFISDRDL